MNGSVSAATAAAPRSFQLRILGLVTLDGASFTGRAIVVVMFILLVVKLIGFLL
jgi:hypothetical protein